MFFSDHILYLLAQAERRMAKIHRKYQWITPTLSTLNLVLTRRFYSMVDESTAICRLMSVACANSCEIIKRETFTTKFHTGAIDSLPIGSLTMQLNELASVPSFSVHRRKTVF